LDVLARRLLVLVLVLMGLTLVAALLAPPPQAPVVSSTGGAEAPADGATDAVEVTVDAAEGQRDVEVSEGDVVHLEVRSDQLDSVELRGLDLIRTVAPDTPAVFDLLADTPGDYEIVLTAADETLGTLRVTPREG
jgi:hypothetical protein